MGDEFTRIKIEGLSKLSRSLKKAGVGVQDMKDANEKTGTVVARAAVPLTPHDTGALAGSIRPGKRQSGVVVRAGGGRIRYARYVEYGTTKMAARPYLRRAAEESAREWTEVYQRELQKLMDQVAAQSDGTGD